MKFAYYFVFFILLTVCTTTFLTRAQSFDAICKSFDGHPTQRTHRTCEGLEPPPIDPSRAKAIEDALVQSKNAWNQAKAEGERLEETFKTECPHPHTTPLWSSCEQRRNDFDSKSKILATTMADAQHRLDKLKANSKHDKKIRALFEKRDRVLKDSRCNLRSSTWCMENVTIANDEIQREEKSLESMAKYDRDLYNKQRQELKTEMYDFEKECSNTKVGFSEDCVQKQKQLGIQTRELYNIDYQAEYNKLIIKSCQETGGMWTEFTSTCTDTCEFTMYNVCGDAMTDACDCGPGKCSYKNQCVENPKWHHAVKP